MSPDDIRVPLTADGDHWSMSVGLGRRVIWAHTFGSVASTPPRVARPDGSGWRADLG